jgi:hypothetical protein
MCQMCINELDRHFSIPANPLPKRRPRWQEPCFALGPKQTYCNVTGEHTWHATVIEGIVVERWRS